MKIELKEITVRELVNEYQDNVENGVIGYGGKLDIRPCYQREFIYKEKHLNSCFRRQSKTGSLRKARRHFLTLTMRHLSAIFSKIPLQIIEQ